MFWQALPESGFAQKGRQCHGGKKSKKRVTVAFFVSASGWKDPKPIVIWKSETLDVSRNATNQTYLLHTLARKRHG